MRATGFDYAVGEEGEGVPRVEVDCVFVEGGVEGDAEGEAGAGVEFDTIAVGREVAGVGDGHFSVGGNMCNAASYKSTTEIAGEAAVEIAEYARGREHGHGAEGSDDGGDGHSGAEAFAADVADGDLDSAVVVGADVVEVAADLGGGNVGALHAEAGYFRRRDDEALLDFAGGVEFGTELIAFTPGSPGAAAEHDEKGEGGEEEGEVEGVDGEGAQGEVIEDVETEEECCEGDERERSGDELVASLNKECPKISGEGDGVERANADETGRDGPGHEQRGVRVQRADNKGCVEDDEGNLGDTLPEAIAEGMRGPGEFDVDGHLGEFDEVKEEDVESPRYVENACVLKAEDDGDGGVEKEQCRAEEDVATTAAAPEEEEAEAEAGDEEIGAELGSEGDERSLMTRDSGETREPIGIDGETELGGRAGDAGSRDVPGAERD